MSTVLLIANPPHPKVDAQVTASLLGMLPVDANLKARYSVPEIWIADQDPLKVRHAADRFAAADMRVTVVDGQEFVKIPTPLVAKAFAFEEQKLTVILPTAKVNISYDNPAIIVPCSPRAAEGLPPPPHTVAGLEVHDDSAFVDIYLRGRHDWARIAIYAEHVDFSGLGDKVTPSHARNMFLLYQLLQRRFAKAIYDDRLVNMQLRRRPGYGTPPQLKDARKGYSYASPGLEALLNELNPALKGISQSELSSRLAFLTSRP